MKYNTKDTISKLAKTFNLPKAIVEEVVREYGKSGLWQIIEQLQDIKDNTSPR